MKVQMVVKHAAILLFSTAIMSCQPDGLLTKNASTTSVGEQIGKSAGEGDLLPSQEQRALAISPSSESPSSSTLGARAASPIQDPTIVDFNNYYSLAAMKDDCAHTFAVRPFYTHPSPSGIFKIHTAAINLDHFHLAPENLNFVYVAPNKIGESAPGGAVKNVSLGRNWPRTAANMNGNSGIRFTAVQVYFTTSIPTRNEEGRPFDLKAIRVNSGTVKVVGYRNDIRGWWVWYPLGSANGSTRWYFPSNAKNLREIQVYDVNENGVYDIDNVELTPFTNSLD